VVQFRPWAPLFEPAEQTQTAEVRSSFSLRYPSLSPLHGPRLLRPRGTRAAALFRSGDRTTKLLSTTGVLAAGFLVPPFGGWPLGGTATSLSLPDTRERRYPEGTQAPGDVRLC
jgi:hypothetical protein